MADESRDWYTRLTRWAKSPTPRPARKSAQDLMNERARKKADRKQKRLQKTRSVRLSTMVGVVLALVGISVGLFGARAYPADRTAEIQELTAQVEQARSAQSGVPNTTSARTAVSALQENSRKIADLQNQYRGWLTSTSDADAQKVADLHTRLSALVPSTAAVRWFSPLVKDSSGKTTAMPADRYQWEDMVTYDVTDTSALPVSWLCKSSDGTLLAWTMATYDANTGTFSQVRTGVTSAGARLLVSDDTAHANKEG